MSTRVKAEAAVVAGVIALAYGTAIAAWRWPLHFLPDLAIALVLLAALVLGLRRYGRLLLTSLAICLVTGTRAERFTVAVLLPAVLAGTVLFAAALYPYYRARVFWAKAERHYAQAAAYMERGLYREALAEFDRQGEDYRLVSPAIAERARAARADTRLRIDRAHQLVVRFRAVTKDVRTPSLDDLLLAQQAWSLYPQSEEVRSARADARQILSRAIGLYVAAIEALRADRREESRRLLIQSKRAVTGLLHQDLLLDGRAPRDLIAFYKREPQLRETIELMPLLRAVLR